MRLRVIALHLVIGNAGVAFFLGGNSVLPDQPLGDLPQSNQVQTALRDPARMMFTEAAGHWITQANVVLGQVLCNIISISPLKGVRHGVGAVTL